ncbi:dihydromonapterin reductase [Candidatus Enterovibrio escicola]|uniref:dihydromonapterin reductase n=1 Tax=Candidatus Enterovibrio escicola TaxID=1927127 RepID=UPI001237D634|nr:dihydromonapterin reductase [Candidatus Enterovibrio escacola]
MKQETIVITGAGQRIGLALAKHFTEQQIPVVVSYRTERVTIRSLRNSGVTCIQADFTTNTGITAFSEAVIELNLNIRGLIHNASDWKSENQTDDQASLLDKMMQVHAKAPYILNHALEPYMLSNSDIIHFTDYVVKKGSPRHIAYAASKAALDNLTLSFAQKFAPKLKVNSIAPALIMLNNHDRNEHKKKVLSKSLLGISPGVFEVINAVQFILNSRYMTGQSINLDGGRALK